MPSLLLVALSLSYSAILGLERHSYRSVTLVLLYFTVIACVHCLTHSCSLSATGWRVGSSRFSSQVVG
ncbi:hypothetical protein F511_43603 [Dorcoceras hygrometricum]|uniref:Uncharacterized protein n=1 Tax=Dorcoceras hygrometricum TaxID=472368 RepID=A0A2Z7A5U9_9LAMI|nr:hypothetical protein F511_43603 [Dorcoceras hygrometricum]